MSTPSSHPARHRPDPAGIFIGALSSSSPAGTQATQNVLVWLLRLALLVTVGVLLWGHDPLVTWSLSILQRQPSAEYLAWPARIVLHWLTPPLYTCTTAFAVMGLFWLLGELVWSALYLVFQGYALRHTAGSYLRVRLARPQSIRRGTPDSAERDLWHALHQLFPTNWVGSGPRPWLTASLHAHLDAPATPGLFIGGGSPTRRAGWVQTVRRIITGHDPLALVDEVADPLVAALSPGLTVGWRDLLLRCDPTSLIRQPDETGADMLGILAGALQPPAGIVYTEFQIATRPAHARQGTSAWRERAQRRLHALSTLHTQHERQALNDKLHNPTYTISVRLVAVGHNRADVRAALQQLQSAFGQFTRPGNNRVQTFFRIAEHTLTLPASFAIATSRTNYLSLLVSSVGVLLALGIGWLLPGPLPWRMLAPLVLLAVWLVGLRWLTRQQSQAVLFRLGDLINRTPRLLPPATWLLPFRCWWSPGVLSTGELGGLWHLPSLQLGSLIEWLPCRHLAPPAHACIPPDDNQRLVIGHALRSDGSLAAVGPSLRDLRKVLHLTAGMGAGKSRLLANLACQLMPNGFFLLDGKGDDQAGSLAATVLRQVTLADQGRVILLDILDAAWPIGLNPLAGIDLTRPGGATQALGMLMAVFSRLDPETWRGAMGMQQYAQMSALLVLEGETRPTMVHIKRVMQDEAYRTHLLTACSNSEVRRFWEVTFVRTGDQQKSSMDALLRRFDNLLTDETLRYLLTQPVPTVDLGAAMEDRSIVIVPMPHMTLGGMAMFVAMLVFQAVVRAAFQRPGSDQTRSTLPLIIDEFQVFVGNGDSQDVRAAITQLRSLGIGGIYAHQSLVQLGDLRDEMLINSGSRIILRTSEPDASAYAHQFPTADLCAADIAGQDASTHQYAQILCHDRPAGPFSMCPLPWPTTPATELPPYHGPPWQTILPPPPILSDRHASSNPASAPERTDTYASIRAALANIQDTVVLSPDQTLDQAICTLVYQPGDTQQIASQLARLPDDLWQLLLDRWQAIRTVQRDYILTHPACIPDASERLRWVAGRLRAGMPLVLALASYQRQICERGMHASQR